MKAPKDKKNGASFYAEHLRHIKSYQATRAGEGLARLNAMENPYGFEDWGDEWIARLEQAEVNRYPTQLQDILQRLRLSFAIPQSAAMIPGNGSDELIQMLMILRGCSNLKVLSPTPSFVMYEQITRILGGEFIAFPLGKDFAADPVAFEEMLSQQRPGLIFLALPNNPTGNMFSPELVEIAVSSGALTVADCAYRFFDAPPSLPSLDAHPNLVILYTLSKIGMAGLRFGFAATSPELGEQLNKIRLPYNINALTAASIAFAADKMTTIIARAAKLAEARDRLYAKLVELPGIKPYPSKANFILFEVLSRRASDVHKELLERKILIKDFHNGDPALSQCLRVSMGTEDENQMFLDNLRLILQDKN